MTDEAWGRRLEPRAAAPFAEDAPLLTILAATLLATFLFSALPVLDIAFSSLFRDPNDGFWLKHSSLLKHVRAVGSYLPIVVGIGGALVLLLAFLLPERPPLVSARLGLHLALVQVLGPGLLVNGVMKPVYDRPRPHETDVFGGEFPFVPAWEAGTVCHGGCASFVSGEAAGAATLFCLVLLAPAAWRGPSFVLFAIFTVLVSGARIAFGAHYLSDVLIAWGLIMAMVLVQHRLLVGDGAAAEARRDEFERSVRAAGRRARTAVAAAIRRLARRSAAGPEGDRPAAPVDDAVTRLRPRSVRIPS